MEVQKLGYDYDIKLLKTEIFLKCLEEKKFI